MHYIVLIIMYYEARKVVLLEGQRTESLSVSGPPDQVLSDLPKRVHYV